MAGVNGRVGVAESATPTKQIDNTELMIGGFVVERQRVDWFPTRVSTYLTGVSGSVTVAVTQEIVEVIAHCTSAGSLTIGVGASVAIPAGSQFSTLMTDAPIIGIGAGSVVCTGTDSYYVRVRPVVS